MKRLWIFVSLMLMFVLLFAGTMPVMAREGETPTATPGPALMLFTAYPSQTIGLGETGNFQLTLRAGAAPQTVRLEMASLPEGWTATFRGGGKIIQSAYVDAGKDATVELRLEQPAGIKAGTYNFVVRAKGDNAQAELTVELVIKDKTPPKLVFDIELPTLKGTPTTTFRYDVTLKNEGDEDLSVNLLADAPKEFLVKFRLTGQEVTNIPLNANESKRLSVEAQPLGDIAAGTYPITVRAQGATAEASLDLVAEVSGQSELNITTADGRLSGQAYAGRETPLRIVVANSGSAPARGVQLNSSVPQDWGLVFDPQVISEIPAGQQVEVTAKIKPPEKAIAGDYMLTIRANPAEGASKSADFRITVLTSTLWGMVGVILIAVAVGVVALAVFRFGRR